MIMQYDVIYVIFKTAKTVLHNPCEPYMCVGKQYNVSGKSISTLGEGIIKEVSPVCVGYDLKYMKCVQQSSLNLGCGFRSTMHYLKV